MGRSHTAAFRKRRALIVANGYYEWKKMPKGPKQPYYFTLGGGEPFAFAGLWEEWRGDGAEGLLTYALITTKPNELAAEVHDRIPVVLAEEAYDLWLDPDADSEELLGLLGSYPAKEMEAHPVSAYVNRPANDDERCI